MTLAWSIIGLFAIFAFPIAGTLLWYWIFEEKKGDWWTFNFRTHWGACLMIWIMCAVGGLFFNPITMLLGSVFPDADHRKAPMGKFIPLWLIWNHRGFVHTLWFAILASIPFLFWNGLAAVSFFAGFIVHLLMDSCTPSGVRWFGGKTKRRYHR